MSTFKDRWVPRLFILAIAPSFAFVIALLFDPTSELARCPLLGPSEPNFSRETDSTLPLFIINGETFTINNTNVASQPLSTVGDRLIFLGIVLDVSSAPGFYGPGEGYSALATGVDSTRALLITSLEPKDMIEDISDLAKGDLRTKLRQWIPFFFNKYPQLGVVVGKYWDHTGSPTPDFTELVELVATTDRSEVASDPLPAMKECTHIPPDSVRCTDAALAPKIKRTRGTSECVCVDENSIFSYKTEAFVVLHFDNCTDTSCTVLPGEL